MNYFNQNNTISPSLLASYSAEGKTDLFKLLEASNLEVLRCYKNFFKKFKESIGGILSIILITADITFSVLFFFFELTKLKRYIFTMTDKYLSYLKQSEKIKIKNPPKKSNEDITNSNMKIMQKRNYNKHVLISDNNKKS